MAYMIKKSEGKVNPKRRRLFLHGPIKIGKSTFASGAPNCLYLALEQRYDHIGIDHVIDVPDWPTFKEISQDLLRGDKRFKNTEYVIIDTVDNAWDYADKWYCEDKEIDHVSDLEWGKGSNGLKTEFRRVINNLFASGYGLIFISHTEDIEVRTSRGDKYTKTVSTLNKHAKAIVLKQVGPVGYFKYKDVIKEVNGKKVVEQRRVISFKGTEEVEAGDGEGKLPDEITVTADGKQSFKRFLAYYEEDDDND